MPNKISMECVVALMDKVRAEIQLTNTKHMCRWHESKTDCDDIQDRYDDVDRSMDKIKEKCL